MKDNKRIIKLIIVNEDNDVIIKIMKTNKN